MAIRNKVVRENQAWIDCDTCGRESKAAAFINDARRLAERDGWLVSWPNGRRNGQPDYCPDHRPADEMGCSYDDTDRNQKCYLPAQYLIIAKGKEFPSCGRHNQNVQRNLFNADPEQVIEIRRLREGYRTSGSNARG